MSPAFDLRSLQPRQGGTGDLRYSRHYPDRSLTPQSRHVGTGNAHVPRFNRCNNELFKDLIFRISGRSLSNSPHTRALSHHFLHARRSSVRRKRVSTLPVPSRSDGRERARQGSRARDPAPGSKIRSWRLSFPERHFSRRSFPYKSKTCAVMRTLGISAGWPEQRGTARL